MSDHQNSGPIGVVDLGEMRNRYDEPKNGPASPNSVDTTSGSVHGQVAAVTDTPEVSPAQYIDVFGS